MTKHMQKSETLRRYFLFIIGLFFSALGVAIVKHGELGVSPISSIPNVLSYKFTSLSMGTWLIIWNLVLIVGQILILRRKFEPIQLLQAPLSFVFGWFTDFGLWMISPLPAGFYPVRLLLVLVGTIVLGFGISLTVAASVILNAGEGFVQALATQTHKQFGNVKIFFDVTSVLTAILLSLFLFDFSIVGTREGTIISALLTGVAVKFFSKRINEPMNRIMKNGFHKS